MIKNNSFYEPIEVDNNYAIIGKLMMFFSCRRNVFLDLNSTSNTNEIMKGTFSYEDSKIKMNYLKLNILIQQNFFQIKEE